jgi:hypothetical protein
MLDNTEWAHYGDAWADVARFLFVRGGRHTGAWETWRLLHHDKQIQVEEIQGRARYPKCPHGRPTAVLSDGRAICVCEGVEDVRAIVERVKGKRSGDAQA